MLSSISPVMTEKISVFELSVVPFNNQYAYIVTMKDRANLKARIPIYQRTLEINKSNRYFCILDNRERHENDLKLTDMVQLDQMLIDGGIEYFYGATVTLDTEYQHIVKMAKLSSQIKELNVDLISTQSYEDAEEFIYQKMLES